MAWLLRSNQPSFKSSSEKVGTQDNTEQAGTVKCEAEGGRRANKQLLGFKYRTFPVGAGQFEERFFLGHRPQLQCPRVPPRYETTLRQLTRVGVRQGQGWIRFGVSGCPVMACMVFINSMQSNKGNINVSRDTSGPFCGVGA